MLYPFRFVCKIVMAYVSVILSMQVMPNGTIGRKTRKRPQVFGDAFDDVHLCIMCLRAIMNHQYGFNMVISHGSKYSRLVFFISHF